jgi:S-DNA-T family DNA segregation ATPase FtsK/SpoIIIE
MPSKSIKKSKKSSTTRKSTKSQKKAVASSKRKVARKKPVTQPIEVEASPSFWESYAEHKERIHSLVYLFGIFVCIYIGLSMLSYDPTIVEGHNVGGVLGNHMAQLLFHFFGYGAWSILFLGGTCAWKLAKRSIGGVARIVGFWGLLWAFNCSLSLVFPAALEQGYFAGGVLGHSTANFLTWIIGPAGAWLTITAWTIGLSLLIVGMDIGGFTNRWIESIESKWPSVGQRSLSFFREVIYWIKDIVVSFKDGLFSRESEEDTQWEEEDSMWYLTDHGTEVVESESIASSEVIEEVDSYHEGFPHSVSEEVELTKTRVKHSESQPSTRSEVSWESTAASQMGTLDNHESLINAKVYSIEESAVGLSRTKSQHAIIPPVEEDISIWYQNSDPSQIDEEDALNALLNEMEQHVSSSSPSSDFSMLSEPSMEAKEKVVQKKSVQVDSFSEPPPVESMSESEVSHHMIFEDEAPSLEVEPEIIPAKKRSTKKKSKIQSFSEPVVEEQIVEEKQNKVEISGPSINPGNLVSGGKKENIVIESDYSSFQLPSLSLLDEHEEEVAQFDEKELRRLSVLLEERLADFNVRGEVMAIRPGPVITTFEFKPARGIKVSKISGLSDDIAMALMAVRVRIVAPIPGRDVVGIEIPNKNRQIIWGLDMVGSDTFQKSDGAIPLVLGKSVEGLPVVCDLAKMPHLLVGGTTGSGKSVGINTMILSMLYKHSPDSLRLILIDPKMLEFEMYHDIPHLIHPVITDSNLATGILKWACDEMDTRYALMAKFKTRTIISFNKRLAKELKDWTPEKARKLAPIGWSGTGVPPKPKKMPYIVIVIDELADLMMVAGKDVESSIIRIAQKARACGIHLIVATQRPSVDVITGMIKANMPCRISFQVRQRTDSRTILDQNGGENLLGRGDMLFLPPGISSLLRCHGPFISDDEVRRVTDFLRGQAKPTYEAKVVEAPPQLEENTNKDDLYDLTVEYIASMGKASTSMIQRKFRIGYNRAARLMDTMEEEGLIGPADGAKPRKVFAKPIV